MENIKPRTMELPRPTNVKCPYKNEYECDVVVVGCGFAGLNAAVSAKEAGQSVIVVDKGRPGYSGLSPWPSSFRWFDPDRGDDADAFRAAISEGGDYIGNMNWYNAWINESKDIYKRLSQWGILAQYPKASEAGDYFEKEDFVGYRETFDKFDRRKKWIEVLDKYEIPYIEHTMVTDAIMENGRIIGVIGFHVPSGQIISVSAKATVLATGGGTYKPTGFPVGGDTFDGEYIAYNLGLPIAGKEFEDFHSTSSAAAGNVFLDNHWQYLENIWLCGGDVTRENASNYASSKGNAMALSRVRKAVFGAPVTDGSEIADVRKDMYTRRGGSAVYETDPEEVRSGKMTTPTPANANNAAGVAVGMGCHLTSGVIGDVNSLDCSTGIPGLYTAGDGIHSTSPSGAAYPCGVGFTSCFCSIDGSHAGKSASEYAKNVEEVKISKETIEEKTAEINAPLSLEAGFDPNWARDVLHSIMAPYWVNIAKTEETLKAALTQVEYMRDHVVPKLVARTSHDLRLCIEMKHKVLSAEMKLRASLARKESRGNHYRADIPYRDDENFLCYMTVQKTADGSMETQKVDIPDEWKGDTSAAYTDRYHYYFPGEDKAKGFTAPKSAWGGKPGAGGKPEGGKR
jgi:succinate dehydrogenase/fumarate reductase flavoprotein subunit